MDNQETSKLSKNLVVFSLHNTTCALPLACVVEVVRMVAITKIPETPSWLAGVINFRGKVVPVMNLYLRLGLPPCELGLDTPIMIIEVDNRQIGLITGCMLGVYDIPQENLSKPDKLTRNGHPIEMIARLDKNMVLVFDSKKLTAEAIELKLPKGLR